MIVLPGTQWYVAEAMQRGGFFRKHDLEIERKDVASVPAIFTTLKAKAGDIAFSSWIANMQFRAQGLDFIDVFPLTEFHNDVMVRPDSPVRNIADLKGRRVGLYGGPAGGTTAMFKVQAMRFFGLDPERDLKMHFGATPLLAGLLEKGELDAIIVTEPVATELALAKKVRIIANLNDLHRSQTGEGLLSLTITVRREFAEQHPQAVRAFIRAYLDGLAYLKGNGALWEELARHSGITSKEGAELLRSRLEKNYVSRWDAAYIAKQVEFAREIQKVFGTKYLPEISADGLTRAYLP
ncbi:MAG: ABC transporter substrate-binding protein [Burkholderiales bacterium]|nr:ABC transporter substrate-binding protein [Burkholderiales bacterium]